MAPSGGPDGGDWEGARPAAGVTVAEGLAAEARTATGFFGVLARKERRSFCFSPMLPTDGGRGPRQLSGAPTRTPRRTITYRTSRMGVARNVATIIAPPVTTNNFPR